MGFCRRRRFPEGSISRNLKMRLWQCALPLVLAVPLVSDACFTEERIALLQIGDSLMGTTAAGWLDTDDCCSWGGVTCSNDTRRVTTLQLSFNGDLPESELCSMKLSFRWMLCHRCCCNRWILCHLGRRPMSSDGFVGLSKLRHLDLSYNCFSASYMESLGKLVSLEVLHLEFTTMVGALPASVFENLRDLKELDLSNNQLTGNLPVSIFTLPLIEHLNVSQNLFEGSIPWSSRSNISSSFRTLDISMNNLSGNFSFLWLRNLTNLEKLYLSGNVHLVVCVNFPGWTPPFQLKELLLSGCDIDKTIFAQPHFLRTQNYLEVLDLSNNSLSGSIPRWLFAQQTTLLYLNLEKNLLSGSLDQIICTQTSLLAISLSLNRISGHLPANISSIFPNATLLDLSGNTISGEIPSDLCNISNMEYLDLSNNNLSGELPSCLFADHPILKTLKVSNNKLGGLILGGKSNLSIRWEIYLDGNNFEGGLPRYLTGNFEFQGTMDFHGNKLSALDISYNQFTGNIDWIHTLGTVRYISLGSNKFNGQISPNLCRLHYLRIIDLSDNQLSGPLPPCIDDLSFQGKSSNLLYWSLICGRWIQYPAFKYTSCYDQRGFRFLTKYNLYTYRRNFIDLFFGFDFSYNKLSGEIPPELGHLTNLKALNLSHNNFVGKIPESFANMTEIESLDLSHNELSGALPRQLSHLSSLAVFSVAYNNLSGCVPDAGQLSLFDMTSFEGNRDLRKASPGSVCAAGSPPDGPPRWQPGAGGEEARDPALYAVSAASFVLSFWITVGFIFCHSYGQRMVLKL
ncbi:unnamed protein product [Urochloa decumbens]|uniref:Leucine-rich repeat-containing N-terminal plant-type domain-containing protein n=1 Tax=Urochloa decumbens TaxID=240449 RepID=A0ABC9D1J6_9POAL